MIDVLQGDLPVFWSTVDEVQAAGGISNARWLGLSAFSCLEPCPESSLQHARHASLGCLFVSPCKRALVTEHLHWNGFEAQHAKSTSPHMMRSTKETSKEQSSAGGSEGWLMFSATQSNAWWVLAVLHVGMIWWFQSSSSRLNFIKSYTNVWPWRILSSCSLPVSFRPFLTHTTPCYGTFSNCRLSVSNQVWPVASVFEEPKWTKPDLSCDLPNNWATSVIFDSEHHAVSHFASATSLTCTARRLLLQTLQGSHQCFGANNFWVDATRQFSVTTTAEMSRNDSFIQFHTVSLLNSTLATFKHFQTVRNTPVISSAVLFVESTNCWGRER